MGKRDHCLSYLPLLAPVCVIVTIVLFSIALFCPNTPTLEDAAQIIIYPSTELQPRTQAPSATPDGPNVWVGMFGSCARSRKGADGACTSLDFNPTYDFSVLPSSAPTYVLRSPPSRLKVGSYIAFGLWPILFVLVTLVALNFTGRTGRLKWVESCLLTFPLLPWLGLICSVIAVVNLWILHLYFERVSKNFNAFVAYQGADGPKIKASQGIGFRLGWVSCVMFCVPWILMLVHAGQIDPPKPNASPNTSSNTKVSSKTSASTPNTSASTPKTTVSTSNDNDLIKQFKRELKEFDDDSMKSQLNKSAETQSPPVGTHSTPTPSVPNVLGEHDSHTPPTGERPVGQAPV